jgi:hypothetical protein
MAMSSEDWIIRRSAACDADVLIFATSASRAIPFYESNLAGTQCLLATCDSSREGKIVSYSGPMTLYSPLLNVLHGVKPTRS